MSFFNKVTDFFGSLNPFRTNLSQKAKDTIFDWESQNAQEAKDKFYDTYLDTHRSVINDLLAPTGVDKILNAGVAFAKYQHKNNIANRTIKPGDDISYFDKLVPKYGNFAGPKYTAGEYSSKVDADKIIRTKPIDELDYATKVHDIEYSLARSIDDLKQSDRNLLQNLSKINYEGLSRDGQNYYNLAKEAFNFKLNTGFGYSFNKKDIVNDPTVRNKLENFLDTDRSYGWTPEPYRASDEHIDELPKFTDKVVEYYNIPIKPKVDNIHEKISPQARKDIDDLLALQEILILADDDDE